MALQTKDDSGKRRIQKTLTIARPVEQLYAFWRDFERLPQFMDHVESVTVRDGTRSHWVVKAPAGRAVEWDAELIDDRENERIAWRSLPGASIENGGEVLFQPMPNGRGTEVRVILFYDPPAGSAGATLAKLFGEEPSQQLDEDLYRFKQLMETGRIITTDGQPVGGKQLEKEEREEKRRVERARKGRTRDEEVTP
jgi:uncharacterized membrane protein